MQDKIVQIQAQPFIKLAQANMALITRFSTSPEVTSQSMAIASQLFQQASESAMKLMKSGAFAHLMQGMQKNYVEFLTEFSQSGTELVKQGQATMSREAQKATNDIIDATHAHARHTRRAHQTA